MFAMKVFTLGPNEHAVFLFAKVLKEIKAGGTPSVVSLLNNPYNKAYSNNLHCYIIWNSKK